MFTPPDTGVNPWPPLSDTAFSSNNGVDAWIAGCGLALLGMVLLAVNLAVTAGPIARARDGLAAGAAVLVGRRRSPPTS